MPLLELKKQNNNTLWIKNVPSFIFAFNVDIFFAIPSLIIHTAILVIYNEWIGSIMAILGGRSK
jgi:uncharacterized membrane protein YdjX (TVP38/TMEM64 family)